MPVFLLIDTNILRRLISKSGISYDLLQLQFLVKEHYVTLMAPQVLLTEWQKHREEERKILLNTVKELEKEGRIRQNINDPGLPFYQEHLDEIKAKLLSQLDAVDELLGKYAVSFEISNDMIVLIYNQHREGKAPFTNPKKNNNNDATLLFSTFDEVGRRGADELYFVSDNTSEFAAPGSKPPFLNPEIAEQFPSVKAHYYTDIRDAYKTFDQLGLPRFKKAHAKEKSKVEKVVEVDTTKPLLQQVHQYLTVRFADIPILPKKLFVQHYPFLVGPIVKYPTKPFTLVTDNQELFDLLTSLQFDEDKLIDNSGRFIHTEEDEQKAIEVLRLLAHNFLHQIAFKNGKEVLLSRPVVTALCNCSLCLHEDLRWADLLKKDTNLVSDTTQSLQSRLRIAYGLYKFKNFYGAAKLFEALREEAKEKSGLVHYIVEFNLQHLGFLIMHHYWEETEALTYGEGLKDIDLEEVFKLCRTAENAAVLTWLHEKEFYQGTLAFLTDKERTIVDLYHNRSSGYNESTLSLLESYYCLEAFLNHNSIIYDIYAEYDTLTKIFTEGVFASHNQKLRMGGRLGYFDDYLLEKLMLAGEAEMFRSYFRRYKLDKLQYRKTNTQGYDLIQRLQQFIEGYPNIKEAYETGTPPRNPSFWEEFNKVLQNGLTLLAMTDISGTVVNDFADKLLFLLQTESHLHLFQVSKSLNYFLSRKHEELALRTLTKFFMFGIDNAHFRRDDEYAELLEEAFKKRNLLLNLTGDEFERFTVQFLQPHAEAEERPSFWLPGTLYLLTENEYHKQTIRHWARNELAANFEANRYYHACMFDLVDPSSVLENQYAQTIETLAQKGQLRQLMPSDDYYTDGRIDQFLNYCFKYSVSIPLSLRAELTTLSLYYKWIIDMESFEYSQFNVAWLCHYFTLYFKQAYRSSNTLKRHLLEFMKTNINSEVERIFIVTYGYDD